MPNVSMTLRHFHGDLTKRAPAALTEACTPVKGSEIGAAKGTDVRN